MSKKLSIRKQRRRGQQQAVADFLIAAEQCDLFKNLPAKQRIFMVPALSRLLGHFPKPVKDLAKFVSAKDAAARFPVVKD